MNGLFLRLAITSVGLWLASELVSGILVDEPSTLLLAAVLLGIVNAIIRPIAILLTIPITIFSLGLFLWVINAAMLGLVARLLDGFRIEGIGAALLGAMIVSLTGWVANLYIGDRGRLEVIVFKNDR
jgi:putative membrane protein